MPLQLPNLDDRRYEDLVAEALGMIPAHAPAWTNHNPSDPGVTLVELFAFLSEMLIYRLNRVTSRNVLSFLKLLNGNDWDPFTDSAESELTHEQKENIAARLAGLSDDELATLVARQLPPTIQRLRRLERAITRQDFETLALQASPDVARVRCLSRKNLELDLGEEREGHVSVIVLPVANPEGGIQNVLAKVREYLQPRLLITTRLHVVKPFFAELAVSAEVVLQTDQRAETVQDRIRGELEKFFDPYPDPTSNKPGWPFGRNIFTSEVIALLDRLPFIDYVVSVELRSNLPQRELPNEVGILVEPYELVKIGQVTVKVKPGEQS
jgi:hypothetical protein